MLFKIPITKSNQNFLFKIFTNDSSKSPVPNQTGFPKIPQIKISKNSHTKKLKKSPLK